MKCRATCFCLTQSAGSCHAARLSTSANGRPKAARIHHRPGVNCRGENHTVTGIPLIQFLYNVVEEYDSPAIPSQWLSLPRSCAHLTSARVDIGMYCRQKSLTAHT